MAMSNTAKVGIAAVAVGGIYLLTRKASAADTPAESNASNLGDVAGCAAGTTDAKAAKPKADMDFQAKLANAAFVAAKLTPAEMPAFTTAFASAYERCYNENKITGGGGGGGKTFIVFDPKKAPSPVAAHGVAVAIGKTKASSTAPASVIASDGTYKSLKNYIDYDPGANFVIKQLQTNSGIDVDGAYGLQTQRAFDYFYLHTGL